LRGRRLQAVATHPMFGPTQLVPSTCRKCHEHS
jgi:hypothetical protein